jgi:site-specific DNA-methyltransferase (adenine-specific)
VTPYYADDLVTLSHGDCLNLALDDWWTYGEVLVTDPPYGVRYKATRGETVANDHDFTTAAKALGFWGQEPRPLAVFANHASLLGTLAAVQSLTSRVRVLTWHKSNVNGAAPGNPWLADVEFAVCGVTEWPKRPVSGLVSARRFTGNPEWNSSPDAYLHPTQKPVPLMEAVILAMPSGVVADPFAGSGSTLVAARNLGRRAIGVELEERYCEVIAKRLAQDVLDFGGGAA